MLQRLCKRQNRKGFTLVEIMAVVAIVGLTTAMSVPNFMRMKVSANEAAAQAGIKSLHDVTEDFQFVNGYYPATKQQIIDFVNTYYKKQSILSSLEPGRQISWKFQGYRYDYRPTATTNGIQAVAYEWIATPEALQVTGNRYFMVNETGVVQEVSEDYANSSYPNL